MSCATVFSALRDTRLTATEKVIFGNIAGGYQTRAEIAKASGCAESSVPRAVRKLETLGYLKRQFNEGKANTYEVLPQPDTGITSDTGIRTTRTDSARGIDSDTGVSPPADTGQTGIEDAEFVDNGARHISTGARAQKLTLNTTSQSELNLQPPVSEVTVVVARASSDTPPPPAWQRVLDEVRSPFLDENKFERLILEGAIVQRWIDAGADEHLDVIPTVRRLIAAKREAVPWNYFTKAVREAASRRKAAEARQLPITAQETRNEYAPSTPGNLRVSGGKIGPGSANYLRNREAARLADEQRRMESVAGK